MSPTGSTRATARTNPPWRAGARAHDLIVCVDCGTLSHGPIAAAKGADVIVLDHHLAEAICPTAWPW
jgi:single-stranded-DNA-specific exonuclease